MRKTNYSYENSKLSITYQGEALITVKFLPDVTVTESDVHMVDQRIKWLTGATPHFLIIDISNDPVFPAEVQEYAARLDVNSYKVAEAIIVSSGWQAKTANLYRNYLRKKHYEQRFFISPEKAREWIEIHIQKNKAGKAR
jgi:hypothetical protein